MGVSTASPLEAVFINIYQLATGFAIAILLGLSMHFVRNCGKKIKAVIVLTIAFIVVIMSQVSGFHESKYIAVIVYGYLCFRMWGEDKPEKELAAVWLFFMPFLFGSVGASIRLDKVKGKDIF